MTAIANPTSGVPVEVWQDKPQQVDLRDLPAQITDKVFFWYLDTLNWVHAAGSSVSTPSLQTVQLSGLELRKLAELNVDPPVPPESLVDAVRKRFAQD